jgi:glutamate/tyrosine decarboxylase-like PLP-dependent enzyme
METKRSDAEMNMRAKSKSLDLPLEDLRRYLYEAADVVVRLYDDLEHKRVVQDTPAAEVKSIFNEPLPRSATPIASLLSRIERDVFGHAMLNIGPHFYGYVVSGGNHAGLIGELLSTALNQNPGKWNLGPAAAEMELRVLQWIAEFIGYPVESAGVLVSGGSAANLTCLKAARDFKAQFDIRKKGNKGGAQLTMYVSTEGHSCLEKSADMLGIGKENLRKIPVKEDFTIDLDLLERRILEDKQAGLVPFCIVGNGGTVNTGAVDPLDLLADTAARHGMWLHVDAAYGGPAAGTSMVRDLFLGLERADSVATDAHKWLYAPYEVGVALVRNKEALQNAFRVTPDYLRDIENAGRHDAAEYHFELSRNFKALRLWMTFKAYGRDAIQSAIEGNIRTMHNLARLVDSSPDMERLAPAPLSIVCFRYRSPDRQFWNDERYLDVLNRKILERVEKDGRVFVSGTIIKGSQALRACCVNHRTETRHVEYLMEVLREIGAQVHSALQQSTVEAAEPVQDNHKGVS